MTNQFASKKCLLLTALALLFVMPLAIASSTTEPVARPDDWWQERNAAVNERVKQGNVDLLMIGDSITHGWDGAGKAVWDQYYATRNAVNMGFSGDRTQHVLYRLENGHLEGISPKLAVIMIGTNNLRDNTAPEIAEGVNAIVSRLRTKLPDMHVLLLAIFPRTDVGEDIQQKLAEVNTLVSKTADADPMVEFLDINRVFLDRTGALMVEQVMPDKLHPNLRGYELWAHAVEPTIARLMGETQWTPLFNGTDLTGWSQIGGEAETWGVKDGLLFTDGEGGGWLGTTRTFSDFELELEFNVPAGGNSGIFVRAPLEGNPAFEGLEIQVLDDAAPEYAQLQPYQYCGSVYSLIAPSTRASKPAGEWQKMYIRYQGTVIQVKLNDTEIVNGDIAQFKGKPDHPGTNRTCGYIGLQNHSSHLDYRNIRIRELPVAGE